MDTLAYAPATEVAARIRGGELTPAEAVEACLRRIERVDPELGAFAELDAERALEAAAAIATDDPRAFAGVPMAIKSNVPVAGLRMEMGSALLAGHRPGHSAYLVRRLREAGFVVVGTTRMPEFGILP